MPYDLLLFTRQSNLGGIILALALWKDFFRNMALRLHFQSGDIPYPSIQLVYDWVDLDGPAQALGIGEDALG